MTFDYAGFHMLEASWCLQCAGLVQARWRYLEVEREDLDCNGDI
ncbi:MAG: hypothetical protein R3E54_01470 [Halioglobus sp.]